MTGVQTCALPILSSRVGPMPPRPTYRLCQAGLGQGRRDPPIACIKSGWVTFFLSQMPFPYQVGLGTPLFCCVQCSWPNSIFPSDRHFACRKPSSQANGWAAARLMPLGTACQVAPGTHSYGVAVWCERSSLAFLSRSPSPPDPTDVASQLPPTTTTSDVDAGTAPLGLPPRSRPST